MQGIGIRKTWGQLHVGAVKCRRGGGGMQALGACACGATRMLPHRPLSRRRINVPKATCWRVPATCGRTRARTFVVVLHPTDRGGGTAAVGQQEGGVVLAAPGLDVVQGPLGGGREAARGLRACAGVVCYVCACVCMCMCMCVCILLVVCGSCRRA